MPTPVTESSEGGQHVEWSETFHAFLFRARIYLKRFWWIVIFTVAAGVGYQAWKNHDIPPVYVSQAVMSVDGIVSVGGATTTSYNENVSNYYQRQVYLLSDQELKDEARKDTLAAMSLPRDAPPPKVDSIAEFNPTASILVLTASGSNPDFTQQYLNWLMQDYLKQKDSTRNSRMEGFAVQLKQVAKDYQDKITELMAQRSDFVSKNNLADLPAQESTALGKYQALDVRETDLWAQLNFLDTPRVNPELLPAPAPSAATGVNTTAVAATEGVKPRTPEVPMPGEEKPLAEPGSRFDQYIKGEKPLAEPGSRFDQYIKGDVDVEIIDKELTDLQLLPANPEYLGLKAVCLQLEARINQLSKGGLDVKHPMLIGLQSRLGNDQNDLEELRRQRVAQLEDIKASIEIELRNVQEQKKTWLARILEYQTNDNKLAEMDQYIKMHEDVYAKAIEGTTTLPEARQLDQEMLTINKEASPASPQRVDVARKIGEGAFVGLAGGIVIIFLLGALDGRVMSVEDLTQRFDEPMLGVIPMQKRINGQVELLKNNDQRQMFAESCRNIRSSLLYMDRQGQRPRVIMLTSSMPSEGKSTLSANLSITLGFASSRTLLVDADMRRGQLHKRFGLKNDMGLAEHIQDGASLDQVIQHTHSENLDFISCGHYPMQPGELLMSERFRESISTMRQRYDFVIFDSPPILLTDDAASFATRADAVVFVVRAGYTRLRQVRTSLENLNRRGVNVYGMVVNFIDHREPGYYSYRYYDYYSYRPARTT